MAKENSCTKVGTTASPLLRLGSDARLGCADSARAALAAVSSRLSLSLHMPCPEFIAVMMLAIMSSAELYGRATLLLGSVGILHPCMHAMKGHPTLSSGELSEADSSLGMPSGCRQDSLATLGRLQAAGRRLKGLSGAVTSAL